MQGDTRNGYMNMEERSREDPVRRWSSASRGTRPQEQPNPFHLDLHLLVSRTVRNLSFRCLSLPVCEILLWQDQHTNTVSFKE